ncbi:hypothetical protein SUGI_0649550 [Cryptomeria japonica]|nr:hypothetical protein SUGI_0649550 [Cryptomeria japonica]
MTFPCKSDGGSSVSHRCREREKAGHVSDGGSSVSHRNDGLVRDVGIPDANIPVAGSAGTEKSNSKVPFFEMMV